MSKLLLVSQKYAVRLRLDSSELFCVSRREKGLADVAGSNWIGRRGFVGEKRAGGIRRVLVRYSFQKPVKSVVACLIEMSKSVGMQIGSRQEDESLISRR